MARAKTSPQAATEAPPRREPVIDMAPLLKPISRKQPAGESLRYEGTYDAVRAARTEDDESLPRGIWEADRKKADWREVETVCVAALAERSKDLQLAIWLAEASFMRHGLAGLADGLTAVNGLLSEFWESLHPQMEDGDAEYRAAPLQWLSDHMAVRLRLLPLNASRDEDTPPFCLADWQRSSQEAPDEDEDGEEEPPVGPYRSRKDMLAAARVDPLEHYRDLVLDADEVGAELDTLDRLVDAHFEPVDAPGLHATREVLSDIRRFGMRMLEQGEAVWMLTGERDSTAEPDGPETAPVEKTVAPAKARGGKAVTKKPKPAPKAAATAGGSGPISNRNDAYERLEEAAAWLMANEPHSPTPYLIQRAVSWRDKSLVELLSELVPDDGYRGFLQSLFGAGGQSSASSSDDDFDDDDWNESDDEH